MFFAAFLGFDAFPVLEDFIGVFCGLAAEYVGVSAYEFVADGSDDILHVELSELFCEGGNKDDLQEEVSGFFAYVCEVVFSDCVGEFVCFFGDGSAEGL